MGVVAEGGIVVSAVGAKEGWEAEVRERDNRRESHKEEIKRLRLACVLK